MELRHARHFVAVAEERNFTRAAARVGIAQPPLSQSIKALEEELGAALFVRRSRGVDLTDAGVAFLDEARALLRQADRAQNVVAQTASGNTGRLRLGYTPSAMYHPVIAATVRAYRERYPNVDLSFHETDTAELKTQCAENKIDAAFIRPGRHEQHQLQIEDEETIVALLAAHPLAQGASLFLDALKGETLLLFPRRAGHEFYDEIIAACHRAGFAPARVVEVPQLTSMPALVAAGIGVAILPRSLSSIAFEAIRYLQIRGNAPVAPLALIVSSEPSKAAINFAALAATRKQTPSRLII